MIVEILTLKKKKDINLSVPCNKEDFFYLCLKEILCNN